MAKVKMFENRALFHCPGCEHAHGYVIAQNEAGNEKHVWEWNEDLDKPTFKPSLLNTWEDQVCHLYVKEGKIQYLKDCTHKLAGQTVDMRENP